MCCNIDKKTLKVVYSTSEAIIVTEWPTNCILKYHIFKIMKPQTVAKQLRDKRLKPNNIHREVECTSIAHYLIFK